MNNKLSLTAIKSCIILFILLREFFKVDSIVSVSAQDFHKSFPAKNVWKSLKALLGWNKGTSCPAPLTVANVNPW